MEDQMFNFYVEQQRRQYEDIKEDIKSIERKIEELQHFKSKLVGAAAIAVVLSEIVIQAIEHLK